MYLMRVYCIGLISHRRCKTLFCGSGIKSIDCRINTKANYLKLLSHLLTKKKSVTTAAFIIPDFSVIRISKWKPILLNPFLPQSDKHKMDKQKQRNKNTNRRETID